ncbi:DUF3016 domain-containing protein [Methylobacillus gramineus]|uniref:DUF3016 domain-containing protein n=1 Tax=Methylobacillus gramineus TaxID=755169 RepID=UPI001CFF782F|nr:DUF3016 domain-containing protein [Methylobacillus gramineus]MCB5184662.1 DUF3016 domain-containing protein [Methylobacillus gramineus]
MTVLRYAAGVLLILVSISSVLSDEIPRPPVQVEYIQPEKFTDISSTDHGPPNSSYLDQLSKHIMRQAGRYLREGEQLTISIRDVDMAGAFEPWNTPGNDIRMMKHIYPPRIVLSYRLQGADGSVLKAGEESLGNLNYMLSMQPSSTDTMRHEKALMGDWLRKTFVDGQAQD